MLHRVGYFIIISFFILIFSIAACRQSTDALAGIDFIISNTDKNYDTFIKQSVPEPFFATSVNVDVDISLNKDDIRSLLDFKERTFVDADKISKSIYYILLKNKFSSIELRISPAVNGGRAIAIKCTSFWTLRKLKIKGFMIGKEMYRQLYLMEPGNVFDEQKHYESLQRITDQFKEVGYFKATVEDSIAYNDRDKTVDVGLRLVPGHHFTIDIASCHFTSDHAVTDELDRLEDEARNQLFKKLRGKKYSKNLINKEIANIKKLLFKKGFGRVDVQLNETVDRASESVHIAIDIEVKKGKEFIFFGNHQFSSDQLLDSLAPFGNSVYSIPPSLLAQELVNSYKEKGFWQASATANEEEGRLFFIINEGNRAIIRKIIIKGMHYFDPKKCIDSYFGSILSACFFDKEMVEQATSDLIDAYNKNGYFDAKVVSQNIVSLNERGNLLKDTVRAEPVEACPEASRRACERSVESQNQAARFLRQAADSAKVALYKNSSPSTNATTAGQDERAECALELIVEEGEQFVLTKIVIDQFPELVDQCPGAGRAVPCTWQLLESQKKWLQDQLAKKGYTDVRITLELIRGKKTVTVSWHIEIKQQACFGKTVIINNGDLPANYLLRELAYKPGDSFNLDLVRQSLKKLRSLDLFDSVSLIPDSSCPFDEKPMILHVEPSDPFEVRLRFGIGLQQLTRPLRLSSLTYKCGGQFMIKNPFNCADKININAELTRAYHDIMMRYERPWIFDRECNFFVQGYSSSYKQPGFFRIKEGLYEVWRQGFSTGISHEFEYAQTSLACGFEWDKTEIRKEFATVTPAAVQALALAPCFLDNSYPYFFVEPSVAVDFRDNRMNPSRGSFTLASLKLIVPLKHYCTNLSSLKLLLDQSFYMPVSWMTLALRARFGYIMAIPLEYIQLTERFYMGGAHSIRSYYPDCTPPLGSFCDCFGNHHFVPQGGKMMVQGTAEMRIPFKNGFSGILFQDLGTLSNNPMSVIRGWQLLSATGFGVSYDTPVGTLRFDIGFKWARHSDVDSRYAWYVALGNPF